MEDFGNGFDFFSKLKKKTFLRVKIFKNLRGKTKTQGKNLSSWSFDPCPSSRLMLKKCLF